MKPEKLALWIINFLLSALLVFAALVLLERIPSQAWPWYSRSLCCAPLLLCFPAGLFCAKRSKGLRLAFAIIFSLGTVVASWFLFPAHGGLDVVYQIISLIAALGLFLLGLRGNEPFPPRAAIASILLYLFICAYFYLNNSVDSGTGEALVPMTWCALANFLLSLYSFNAFSLRGGLHNVRGKGGSGFAVPTGMRGRNLLMLTIFLVVAVPIASLSFLHKGLGAAVGFVLGGIWKLISLLAGGDDSSTEMPVTAPVQEEREPEEHVLPDVPMNNAAHTFVLIFIGAMLLIGLIVLIAVLAGGNGGGRFSLKRFWERLRPREVEEDYEDSVERTLDLKGILKEKREQVSAFFAGLTARPERFEDMPDGRMKLRFVYKSLLNSSRVNEKAQYCTPSELGRQLKNPELEAMAEEYNAARYRLEAPVPPDAADTAEKALTALRRGRRK